ncbi:hypothetical protein RsoM2USA_3 [Ralstonia phage RsoM2USA]|nr:hypothetical protein RsoM2USA_3 [Ralstonia phage RsoM2USA]
MNELVSLLREASKMSVGLERLLDIHPTQLLTSNFPPYDILRLNESEYVVCFAVAGYSEENLTVTVRDGNLIVSGLQTAAQDESTHDAYIHKGIATRAFTKVIPLALNSQVTQANLENGILSIIIKIKNDVDAAGIKIPIGKKTNEKKEESNRQILMEDVHPNLMKFAQDLYEHHAANHPTLHCNLFAPWSELSLEERDEWIKRAKDKQSVL